MWANLSSKRREFEDSELLILKRALAAYKRELQKIEYFSDGEDLGDEISRVDSLQLRFIGIKDDSNPGYYTQ